MKVRRGRGLTDEDRALWEQVAATVKRRRPRHPEAPSENDRHREPVAETTLPPSKHARSIVKPVGRPEPAVTLINTIGERKSALDGKRAQRLRKGELPIEARIDLHGMTLDLAHAALGGFLVQARTRGHRCVLVITGKGGAGGGALKQLVPRWLGEAPFAAMIADRVTAQPRHGGEGAIYVYLRRKRP